MKESTAHNLYVEVGHFKEHRKVYGIILNSPMRGSKNVNGILPGKAEISNACKNGGGKMLGKDTEWTKVFAGIKKNERNSTEMVSNKDLLSNSCDKLNSEGYGSGQGQRMQFLLNRKRHNFSHYVPM